MKLATAPPPIDGQLVETRGARVAILGDKVMAKFNPTTARELLLGPVGIGYELNADFDSVRAKHSLNAYADSFVDKAIECILVRFDQPAVWLLEKAKKWLLAGIEARENPYHAADGGWAMQHESLAQCNWLLTGVHDVESLHQAVASEDRHRSAMPWDEEEIEVCLPLYYESREHVRVCDIFESVLGKFQPNLSDIQGEGSMVYVMSLHQLGRRYTDDEIQAATQRFLGRFVADWLERGQFPRVARWMKLVYWCGEESQHAAWQSLLRCYDFLPGVDCPEAT